MHRPQDYNMYSLTNIISNYLQSISYNKTVYLCRIFNFDINKYIKYVIDNIYQFGYHHRCK